MQAPDKPEIVSRPDELDKRLAMSYEERYKLMMRLFRMGKMMEKARVRETFES